MFDSESTEFECNLCWESKREAFTNTKKTLNFLSELQFRIRELINFIYDRSQWSFVSKLRKFGIPECAGFIEG